MAVEDLIIPKYYENKLDIISTEIAIKYVKDLFERRLAHHLNLMRISAPLYVSKSSGLNDDLNGTERPVAFDIMEIEGEDYQIVHSLAKWKRMALKRYNLNVGKGIYTDMNAIRRDEVLDNLHSCYVDQWDWEKIISRENRTMEFLKMTVRNIMKALKETEKELDIVYENLMPFIQEDVYFITAQELEDRFPDLTPKEREYEIVKQHRTVFLMKIGDILNSGEKHDGRAPVSYTHLIRSMLHRIFSQSVLFRKTLQSPCSLSRLVHSVRLHVWLRDWLPISLTSRIRRRSWKRRRNKR